MKKKLRIAVVAVAALAGPASAQHLWYNDPGAPGDLLIGSVMVDASAPYTYYETLGWNQGGLGGGYTGIQDNGNGQHSFICSIWDPSNDIQMTRAQYVPPGGSFAKRFGGEGTGFQIFNPAKTGPQWQLGNWYTIAVRAYNVGAHTYVAAWLFDSANEKWTLQGIHDYPVPMVFNYGAMAFLENYGGQFTDQHRRMYTGWGFKRTLDQAWWPFTHGAYDGPAEHANGGTEGETFYMQTGAGVVNTVGTSESLDVPPFGSSPSIPEGLVGSASAIYDPRSRDFIVSWKADASRAPQFAYEIQISKSKFFTGQVIEQTAVGPEIGSVHVSAGNFINGMCYGRVRIVDLLDRTSPWVNFTVIKPIPTRSFVYLSDLAWDSASNGWGPVEYDQSNGETGAGDGSPITLNGVVYAKGIGCHANSQITYRLDGRYQWFLADVGIDDEIGGVDGSASFRVYVDGVLRYDSTVMNASTSTQPVQVGLAGAQTLELVTDDFGNGNAKDHTDWADARLIKKPWTFIRPGFH